MRFHVDRDPTTSRVYKFGALAPTTNLPAVREALFLANCYRNDLVEIERRRRDRYYTLTDGDPEVAAAMAREAEAQAVYDAARAEDMDARKESGKRTTSSTAKQALRDLRAAAKVVRETRKAVTERHREALRESDAVSIAEVKAKRAEYSERLHWGTRGAVERENMRSGPPPKFHRFDGTGRLAVQVQGGMTFAELRRDSDTRVRLKLRDDWGSDRRKSRHGVLWLRIGSEGRAPVWATVPVYWHRYLPENARIKWVELVLRRVGTREQWSVCVTVEMPGASPVPVAISEPARRATCAAMAADGVSSGEMPIPAVAAPAERQRAIAFDVGWRKKADGSIRVAYGFDGEWEYEVALPAWVADGYRLVHDLRSIRDHAFNAARDRLHEARNTIPRELAETAASLAQWRSPGRLDRLACRLLDVNCCPDWLDDWRRRNRHLYQWERECERYLRDWRTVLYREWAAWIAARYDVVLLEAFNLAEQKRKAKHGEDKEEAIGYHVPASPGEWRRAVVQAMQRERREVLLVPAKNTTIACWVCGEATIRSADLVVQCRECGSRVDQDAGAARNIHAYASAGVVDQTPVTLAEASPRLTELCRNVPRNVQRRIARLAAALATSPPDGGR